MKKLVHDKGGSDCQPLYKPGENREMNTTPQKLWNCERQVETKDTGKKCPSHVRRASPAIKEIRSTEIVCSKKFLGSRTFGSCYLAHYRGFIITVKEFKVREKTSLDDVKKEVRHEATVISHLCDHPSPPLLFGIVTRSEPLHLIIQFHGQKDKSFVICHGKKCSQQTQAG